MPERFSTVGVPTHTPGDDLTPEDMARVTEDDWRKLYDLSRRYCGAIDATRSRKRANGCATVVRDGRCPYGSDDVTDDVAQDAVLHYARRLRDISERCAPASLWIGSRTPASWQYVRRDGETITVTHERIRSWAVRAAAANNGYRMDVASTTTDKMPGEQQMRPLPHAEAVQTLATAPHLASNSAEIFRTAFGDGGDFPTLRTVLTRAADADSLARAGIWQKTAQDLHGGPRNSSSKVQRTRDDANREWRELTARLDATREDMAYQGIRGAGDSTRKSEESCA